MNKSVFIILCFAIKAALASNQEGATVLNVQFHPNAPALSPVVPKDYVGISVDWPVAATAFNSAPVQRLLRHLVYPNGNEDKDSTRENRLNIRVGGNGADHTWWNEDHAKNPSDSCQYYYDDHKRCANFDMTTTVIQNLIQMAENVSRTSLILDLTMVELEWALEEWIGIWYALKDLNHKEILEGIEIG